MSNFTSDLEKQLSRLGKDIQDLVERVVPAGNVNDNFQPPADVIESDHLFKIELDVPGMDKSRLQITLKDRVVTISGERKTDLSEGETLRRSERKKGAFSRSFALPETAEPGTLAAAFSQGVLTVTAKKSGVKNNADGTSIPIE